MIAAALFLLAWLSPALAADPPREPIDAERFKPAITHDPFVVTEGSDVRWPPKYDPLMLGVTMQGSLNSLVLVTNGDITERYVAGRLGIDLFGSYTIVKGFALSVGLPVFALQSGDEDPNGGGIGDLRIAPKFRLHDDRQGTLGVAIIPELRLPTHSDDEFSGGARSVSFAPKLALDHRFPLGLRIGANVGVLLRRTTLFENIEAASEFTYSAAASVHLGGYGSPVAIGADIHGGAGLAGLDVEELPLEGQAYVQIDYEDVQFQAGPAMGLVAGYGTPTFRLYGGFRWYPTNHDRDDDGIPDAEDKCPDQPETINGRDDDDGCPEKGAHPGLVRVTIVDAETGEPIRRSRARVDEDRADATEDPGVHEVTVSPGKHVLWARARGYVPQRIPIRVPAAGEIEITVPLERSRVTVTEDRIEFDGTVYFAFDSAELEPESHDLLDEIALVINANPSLRLIRVEGHTDKHGTNEYNQRLSEARAQSVLDYLVSKEVDPDRLEAEGFGEERPISKLDHENRRVEFVIARGHLPGATIERTEPTGSTVE